MFNKKECIKSTQRIIIIIVYKHIVIYIYINHNLVGITVKNNPGSNSDIDNKPNPNFVLLCMLSEHSEYLHPKFNQHLVDQLLIANSLLHTQNGLNHEQKHIHPCL